jgi:hypothetical protein
MTTLQPAQIRAPAGPVSQGPTTIPRDGAGYWRTSSTWASHVSPVSVLDSSNVIPALMVNLDLEAHGLPKLALRFLDVKKLAARLIGSKSFEKTARELAPDDSAMPRPRALADARRTARILHRLLRPLSFDRQKLPNEENR